MIRFHPCTYGKVPCVCARARACVCVCVCLCLCLCGCVHTRQAVKIVQHARYARDAALKATASPAQKQRAASLPASPVPSTGNADRRASNVSGIFGAAFAVTKMRMPKVLSATDAITGPMELDATKFKCKRGHAMIKSTCSDQWLNCSYCTNPLIKSKGTSSKKAKQKTKEVAYFKCHKNCASEVCCTDCHKVFTEL